MRNIGKAVSVLLMAAMIVTLVPGLLWAGAETGSGGIIPTNPNASGTKVSGPVTIFYDVIEDLTCDSVQRLTGISVVMALTKGNTLNTFSNDFSLSAAAPCFPAIDTQISLITQFIQLVVIPILFPATPTASFEYKSATAPSPTQTPTADSFAVSLNVVIAVH
jgi:hypothetical protein